MITADCNACQHEDKPLCNRCFIPENSKMNKPSNADRIRAMTDEELAQFLCETHVFEGACSGCIANEYCKPGHNGMFEWLREEVKE